ncbi:PREDICTED: ribose-5-phosphate isomerase [Ceratosolen solmsi marchali]|uniref:Ribose-5-phosphate isomerase n=1 Tax=Ceratosolen solmsi marchali TaxID=326594 RepID=A0AAJ6VLX6_9HYME|nr:PREDICTED: ribose-5-phosphate isomerase [Ceratosolen solmsi marchali]
MEQAKQTAAYNAIDTYIKDNDIVGIGSGSTIVYAVERLGQRVKEENLNVVCVPTSFQSRQLIIKNSLKLGDLETHPNLDCVIDGADEVDSDFNLIKGGGGCLLQEKIIASCTKNFIVVADIRKDSVRLGEKYKKVPIEVLPMAYVPVMKKIEDNFGGKIKLRMAVSIVGPVVTENGNFILDWHFPDNIRDWSLTNKQLLLIPGLIETGLFINMVSTVIFGQPNGYFEVRSTK